MNEPRSPTPAGSQAEAAQAYIAGRVKAGASKKAIVQELIQRGYDHDTANQMVKGISGKHATSMRKSGLIYIIVGVLIAAGGISFTIESYGRATQQGGYYYIWFGAVIFGIALAIRGIIQLIRGREVK